MASNLHQKYEGHILKGNVGFLEPAPKGSEWRVLHLLVSPLQTGKDL